MELDLELNLLSKKTIFEELLEHSDIIIFLQITGIIKPISSNRFYKTLNYIWYYFSKLSFLIIIAYFIGLFATYNEEFFYMYIYTINFYLQSLSLPFPIYQISCRLYEQSVNNTEIKYIKQCLKYSYIYIFLMIPLILLYFIGKIIHENEQIFILIFLIFVFLLINITCYLSTCLLFIISDAENICGIINEIIECHQTLTIEQYLENKDKINILLKRNFYINYIVIFIALLNIIVLLILLTYSKKASYFYEYSMPILFIKEIIFVTFLLYFISKVNQKADNLIKIFGNCRFCNSKDDLTRIIIYNDLKSDKISYYIFGRRITKRDVILQFITIFISSMVTFFREIYL